MKNAISRTLWSIAPSAFYHPQEGSLTPEGMRLTKKPSLESKDEVRFAAMSDYRFYFNHLYKKLIPFLPEQFEVVGEPNGQNCFMYCLNIDPATKKFGRKEFDAALGQRNYNCLSYEEHEAKKGDIIVYAVEGFIDSVRKHAALYIGDGRVRSRWGINSPLLEHPLKAVIPTYWSNQDERYLSIERRGKRK